MRDQPAGRVSGIVPARNEEINLRRVIGSLVGQAPLLEIIVVDDASTDGTEEILEDLAARHPLLRILRVEHLPEGWTGKTYACALAAAQAGGDWLLFTDADTEHLPGSVAYWVERAEREGLDLVSLSPGQMVIRWWEKAAIPQIFAQLARWYPFDDVSRPDSRRAAANGQYLLVRREVYQQVGGFESVRSEILDDVRFAERVKAHGCRIFFADGAEWVRARMYTSFRAMWEGWTKNLYWLAEGRWPRGLAVMARAWLLDFIPFPAFVMLAAWSLTTRQIGLVTISAAGCLFLALARRARYSRELARLGFDRRLANYQWLGAGLLGALALSSFCAYRTGQRIQWKGRGYSSALSRKQK
jgi:glycosyltransferase involved in cell wall biosynthesis